MQRFIVRLILLFGLILQSSNSFEQCTTLGQTPSSAFPVCAVTGFNQTIVPTCRNNTIASFRCNSTFPFQDKNPFYYKFSCRQTGTLGFLIKPNIIRDDYDWFLFDITGANSNDIYTNDSLLIASSYSVYTNNKGITGTDSSGSQFYNCQPTDSQMSRMPIATTAHEYLLMVSNYTGSNNGYTLDFVGGTAQFGNPIAPTIKNTSINCAGNKIFIELNKTIKCNSIAADGSDFVVSNGIITNANGGNKCNTGFDTDSVIINLSNPLTTGTHFITVQQGNDFNTLLDICATPLAIGSKDSFVVTPLTNPVLMDSLLNPSCEPQSLDLIFKSPIKCNSVAPNGSDFKISGPSLVNIISATTNCSSDIATKIHITFLNPINIVGTYKLILQNGNDNNTLLSQCDIATPLNSSLNFNVYKKPDTAILFTTNYGCLIDTIHFYNTGGNGVYQWQWEFDNSIIKNTQSTINYYSQFNSPRTVKLKVFNNTCVDSNVISIDVPNHLIKAIFNTPDSICPLANTFVDSSKGNIVKWNWVFANGSVSNLKFPPSQNYPISLIHQQYSPKLVVTNAVGCVDSISKKIIVKPGLSIIHTSIDSTLCSPTSIAIHFNLPFLCSSISSDGSEFKIIGPSTVKIINTTQNCINGFTKKITLHFDTSVNITGLYKIIINSGTDGNSLINDCNYAPLDSFYINFYGPVKSKINYKIEKGCKLDTILFSSNNDNGIIKWNWFLNGVKKDTVQNSLIFTNPFKPNIIKLIVLNNLCADSSTKIIPITYDSLKARISTSSNLICPAASETLIAKDSSRGNIVYWNWDFANNNQSSLKYPLPQIYPLTNNFDEYLIKLIVANNIPCYDTAYKKIRVANCLIEVPTAFTPNGDNHNDYLYPLNGYRSTNLTFKIFNRFGQLVFETNDWTKKWDGKFNGMEQPTGTYVWILDYININSGKRISTKGTTVLIR